MKKILKFKLKLLAILVLKRYKPKVIAITGSIGKTSTKEAVYQVLKRHSNIRASYKNYNNELGVPLTILGQKSAKKSIADWFLIILRSLFLLIKKNKDYPKILVLEMGIDRPKDMHYLCSIVKPDIAIVTAIGLSHIEFFKTQENIIKEKRILVENVKSDGLVILNHDQPEVLSMASKSPAKHLSFGFNKKADLNLLDYNYDIRKGTKAKLSYQGSLVPAFFPNLISQSGIYSCLAAILVAVNLKMNLLDSVNDLKNFSLPAGRMRKFEGLNDSIIIDDTYNASPESTISAIESLALEKNKILVLGDILEIGEHINLASSDIAREIIKNKFSQVITKGDIALLVNRELLALSYPAENLRHFSNYSDIISYLKTKLHKDLVVLVKGSQGARMEHVVKALLKNIGKDKDSLVRQEKDWLKNSSML